MPQPHRLASKPALAATTLLLVIAGLALAACGGSSTTTTTAKPSTSASATTPTQQGNGPAAFAKRFAERRECLAKQGIKLPTPSTQPGQGRPPGGGFLGGTRRTFKLPAGVSRAQYEAALKKCGGFGGRFGAGGGFNSPQAHQALAKFAACMKENGVDLPAPNTSGNGPAFNTKGINTSSATFQAAEAKCRADIRSVFPGRPGAGAGGPGAGGPGGGAPGAPPSAG